jgi:large subunit ribosomal protein L25
MAMRIVEAEPRSEFGKGPNRRLRAKGLIPAVVYGGKKPTVSLAISPKELISILRSELGANTIFELRLRGQDSRESVMVREYQLEPVGHGLLHADLVRIAMDQALTVHVHVELIGTPVGVKTQGGVLEFVSRTVDVSCLPGDIPEKIEVDVSELTIGKLIRVGELTLPPKVKLVSDPGVVIAHVVAPRAEAAPEEAAVAAPAEPTEPEVIKRGKQVAEEEGTKGAKPGKESRETREKEKEEE